MASFTATTSGVWNSAATWGGSGYPCATSAADTATIPTGKVVTQVSDNPVAGTGAVTINSGGTLVINCVNTQALCGAVTNNGTLTYSSGAKLITNGSIISNNNSYFSITSAIAYFNCTSNGQYGLTCAAGCNTNIVSSTISGTPSYGAYAYLRGGALGNTATCNIQNLTCDYMYQYGSDPQNAGTVIDTQNQRWGNQSTINNITTTHSSGSYAVALNANSLDDMTITLDAGLLLYNTYLRRANITINKTTSTQLIYSEINSMMKDCVCNLTSTYAGQQNGIVAQTANGGFLRLEGGTYTINTPNATSGTHIISCAIDGATLILNGTASQVGIDTYLETHNVNVKTNTALLFLIYERLLSIKGGVWDTSNCVDGFAFSTSVRGALCDSNTIIKGSATNLIYWGASGYGMTCPVDMWIQHLGHGNGQIIFTGTNVSNSNTTVEPLNEPYIYVTNTATKTFAVQFDCYPLNHTDFTYTGNVTFYNASYPNQITMATGSTLTTPVIHPWQVASWNTCTITKTGTLTYEYRASSDGGNTWGNWVSFASGGSLSAIACKANASDCLQIRVTNNSGSTAYLDKILITGTYTDLTGTPTHYWLMPEMQGIIKVTDNLYELI